MNTTEYKLLCNDLEQIASELEGQEPACDFSEDAPELFELDADFNEIWSDRS